LLWREIGPYWNRLARPDPPAATAAAGDAETIICSAVFTTCAQRVTRWGRWGEQVKVRRRRTPHLGLFRLDGNLGYVVSCG